MVSSCEGSLEMLPDGLVGEPNSRAPRGRTHGHPLVGTSPDSTPDPHTVPQPLLCAVSGYLASAELGWSNIIEQSPRTLECLLGGLQLPPNRTQGLPHEATLANPGKRFA